MILCSVLRKPVGNWSHLTGSHIHRGFPALRKLPDNATHVELTVSHSELIVSDSELAFSYIPFIFYIRYIYR
jgi:hypothetical protein